MDGRNVWYLSEIILLIVLRNNIINKLKYFFNCLIKSNSTKKMSRNQLDEELIAFAKTIFASFDEIIAVLKKGLFSELFTELDNIGYDGTLTSILDNAYFWDMLSFNFIQFHIIYQKMKPFKEKLLDAGEECLPYAREVVVLNREFIIHYVHDYFISNWCEKYRDEIREWAQDEFCFCPK